MDKIKLPHMDMCFLGVSNKCILINWIKCVCVLNNLFSRSRGEFCTMY